MSLLFKLKTNERGFVRVLKKPPIEERLLLVSGYKDVLFSQEEMFGSSIFSFSP